MHIEILTPEKTLFEGEATSINLPGISGSFELLNNHAPIISALGKGNVIVKSDGTSQTIAISDGFVECLNNKVVVLAGSAVVA